MDKRENIINYLEDWEKKAPLLLHGDSLELLKIIPDESIDCVITSPPYWGHRHYSGGGIGQEKTYEEFILNLSNITKQIHRVLKNTGSFWLNLGDAYRSKKLLGIPWRVALRMIDEQDWVLRNSVIWNKHKGGLDSSRDKLRNIHENIFHFVKDEKNYFYDGTKIRLNANAANSYFEALGKVAGDAIEEKVAVSDAEIAGKKALYFPIHIFSFSVGLAFFKIVENEFLMSFHHFLCAIKGG